MIKQLTVPLTEETFPQDITYRPEPAIQSDPEKRRTPVAVWTSLIAAKALAAHYEANHVPGRHPDIEVIPFEDLAFLESNQIADYELLYMGIYERDAFSEAAMSTFKLLTSQKKHQSTLPVTICHCGRSESKNGQRWRHAIKDLSDSCKVRVHYFHNEIYRGEFSL